MTNFYISGQGIQSITYQESGLLRRRKCTCKLKLAELSRKYGLKAAVEVLAVLKCSSSTLWLLYEPLSRGSWRTTACSTHKLYAHLQDAWNYDTGAATLKDLTVPCRFPPPLSHQHNAQRQRNEQNSGKAAESQPTFEAKTVEIARCINKYSLQIRRLGNTVRGCL